MKITNVRWGLKGEPQGQPCLFFELDGRPASAFWDQKQGVTDKGYLYINFEDNQPSHLPDVKIYAEDDPSFVVTHSDQIIYSPWLNDQLREMCAAELFVDGYIVGDAPAEGA